MSLYNMVKLFIKRPILTIVLTLLMLILGAFSFYHLNIRHLPNISEPYAGIYTRFNGANADLIEKQITTPIENILAGIPGILEIKSSSQNGSSNITLKLDSSVDSNEVINDIRNKVAAIIPWLPKGADAPSISKNDSDATPLMVVGFNSSKKNALELTDYLKRYVSPAIEQINGVGQVNLYGARDYSVKIILNPSKMTSYHIRVADIREALLKQNIDIPSGEIKSKNRIYAVVTESKFKDASSFSRLILAKRNQQLIRLSDVAEVVVESDSNEHLLRINGHSGIGLAIIAQSQANPVDVAKAVMQRIHELKTNFPDDLSYSLIYDQSSYIKSSIHELFYAFIEAIICVALVVFLFIGQIRAALIPIVTVPICLIAVCFPMRLFGFELNTLTLLAMVLAIGLVVDDAIVVLENCHRHLKNGLSKMDAAILGSQEITFAIIAMTLTLAAVYAPMALVDGFTGKLFQHFGITLALCVLISGIVALTLSPMMCARWLGSEEGRYEQWVNRFFIKLSYQYRLSLDYVLNRPVKTLIVVLMVIISGWGFFKYLPSELAPVEDQSYIIVPVKAPTNSSSAYVNHYMKELEQLFSSIPEAHSYFVYVRPGGGWAMVRLKPWGERKRNQKEITKELNKQLSDIVGLNLFAINPNPLNRGSSFNQGIDVAIMSNRSWSSINDLVLSVIKSLEQDNLLQEIQSNLAMDSEQVHINIHRELAADLQVPIDEIADLLSTMMGGSNPMNFEFDGQTYPVLMQLPLDLRQDVKILDHLFIQNCNKELIPLSTLIDVYHAIAPESYPHLDRQRTATISAELNLNRDYGETLTLLEQRLHELLPEDVHFRFVGAADDYIHSSGSSLSAFGLALLFIFLILSAQFESFIDPFIVLISIPLSLAGAVVFLWMAGGSMNIYSSIGMVTLIGLVSKHGILITEFANAIKRQGKTVREAVMLAAELRLKPILMTTMAMLLGALPLVFATGAGSESRAALGTVIVGGLLFGTFFALYLVPLAYCFASRQNLKNQHCVDDHKELIACTK